LKQFCLSNEREFEDELEVVHQKQSRRVNGKDNQSPIIKMLRKERGRDLLQVVFHGHAHFEVKMHAVYARIYVGLKFRDIAKAYGKSKSTICNWVKDFRKNGEVQRKKGPRKIYKEHRQWLVDYVHRFPLAYLSEIHQAFVTAYFPIGISTIFGVLTDAGITKKVLEKRAIEIQENELIRFTLEVNDLSPLPSQLLFLDEMSCDNRSMLRKRGWFHRRSKPIVHLSYRRTDRISILSFLGCDGLVETVMADGTFTRQLFFNSIRALIRKGVVQPYPGRYSVWIMDSAAIHMDSIIIDYLFSMNIYVFFLPPYCPFYNPIEIFFGLVKQYCKKYYLGKRGTEKHLLSTILLSLCNRNMRNIFVHCGYNVDGSFDPSTNYSKLKIN
jgi:transposase